MISSLLTKAKAAVNEGRIIRLQLSDSYFYIYVFLGKKRDYILTDSTCTCKDFLFNVLFSGKKEKCYHLVALDLALSNDKVIKLVVNQKTLIDIIMEVYSMDKSYILRKLLFTRGSS